MTVAVRGKLVSHTYINLPQQQAVTFCTSSAFFTGVPFFKIALGRGKSGRNQKLKGLNCSKRRNIEMAT